MSDTQQIQGVLENIESRKVNTRYGEKFVYTLMLRDDKRKIAVWDRELAEQAWTRKDQLSIFQVETSTNTTEKGTFTNYTLKAVFAPTESMQSLGSVIPQAAPQQFEPTSASNAAPMPQPSLSGSEKDKSIHRQVATKVAAVLSKTETDFWANVDSLIRFYETGEKPGSQVLPATGSTNHPEPTFDAPVPDDDIPF